MNNAIAFCFGFTALPMIAVAGSTSVELTSGCKTLFSTQGHSTQILGIEPIAGNALQAILPTLDYKAGQLEFGKTTIEYFNSSTWETKDISLVPGPGNSCQDHGLPGASFLQLDSIHFKGFGLGERAFGCYLGMVDKDIISNEKRPMIICTDEYSESHEKVGNYLLRPGTVHSLCYSQAAVQLGIPPQQCQENVNRVIYWLDDDSPIAQSFQSHSHRNSTDHLPLGN